jgi:hypothetical protein
MSSNGWPIFIMSGNQGTIPAFAWRCMFMPWSYIGVGGEWLTSRPSRFYPGMNPGTLWKRAGWDPEPGWTFRRNENVFAPTGIRTMDSPGPSGSHGSWYPGWDANRWLPKHISAALSFHTTCTGKSKGWEWSNLCITLYYMHTVVTKPRVTQLCVYWLLWNNFRRVREEFVAISVRFVSHEFN